MDISVGAKGDLARSQHLGAIAHGQHGLTAGIAPLVETDACGQTRVGQGAGGQAHIIDLDILILFPAEADGMHGNVAAAQRGDGVQIDSAGIVRAVAEQYDSSDRQVRGFVSQLLEAIPDARDRRRAVQFIQAVDAAQFVIHAVEPRLEPLPQTIENAALQCLDGLGLPRRAILGDTHASRIIHDHGDDVLLRLQLRDHESGLPQ